jgi:Uma2 family endonuclease
MEPTLVRPPDARQPGPFTWTDFLGLDDDDGRELIDGYLLEVDVPTQLHQYIVGVIIAEPVVWVRAYKAGTVLASGYKVQVTQKRGIMPDVQYFRAGHLPPNAQQGLTHGRPDLAVEVISPSSRAIDRVTKLNWYASLGVPEYWLVDPESRVLQRLLLQGDRYVVEPYAADTIFRPDTFVGLEIRLSELWILPDSAQP